MTTFSDGVFAIAMTLMVVQLTVPLIPSSLPSAEIGHRLASALTALWPAYFSFGLSFVVIAASWVAHHRRFQSIRRYDSGLIWLNMLLLLCVVFVPFPTAVLGHYGGQTVAVVLYAATMAVTAAVSVAMTLYTDRRRLSDPMPDPVRSRIVGGAVVPAVFLASIPVALVSPNAAEWSWLALFVLSAVVGNTVRRLRRRSR
jgi:uncharacterized membrane protein